MKGLLLCLITNYRLVFLRKAQMVAKSCPALYFHTVNPFSNLKKHIVFRKKNIDILKKRLMIFFKPPTGSKIADKLKMAAVKDKYHVTKNFEMMNFFNCFVQMHGYSTE